MIKYKLKTKYGFHYTVLFYCFYISISKHREAGSILIWCHFDGKARVDIMCTFLLFYADIKHIEDNETAF